MDKVVNQRKQEEMEDKLIKLIETKYNTKLFDYQKQFLKMVLRNPLYRKECKGQ